MLVLLGAALLIGLATFSRFARAEREGRPEVALIVLLGAICIEAICFQSENNVPRGLFRPVFGGQSFRLPELVIGAALAARLVVHGLPRRVSPVGGAWAAFLTWYGVQAVLGLLLGNPLGDVLYQVRAIVYLGGAIALVVAVPPAVLVSPGFLRRGALALGAVVAVLVPLGYTKIGFAVALPGAPLNALGRIGADSASIFVVVGLFLGLLEISRDQTRPRVLAACVPLLAAPFATSQRAAIVGLAVSASVVVLAAASRTWHARRLPTGSQLGIAAFALVAVGAASLLPTAGEPESTSPVVEFYEDAFESTRKQQSADTRLLLWDEAHRLWWESPLTGSGLGKQFQIKRAATQEDWVAGGFHNLVYDLLVRSGVVGLVLFSLAMGLSYREGILAWRRHLDRRVAALALAALAAASGLLAKGMVESVLEKAKLSTLLGVAVGVMIAAHRSAREQEASATAAVPWTRFSGRASPT